ncbi:MAG: sigma-70 family RNA polymerase sigma factor [Flavobacteriales bacterium]|nr:sigma-70 family RNA polymerase sigma factor [Flavobacteriales bacterium]
MLFNLSNRISHLSDEELIAKFQKSRNKKCLTALFDRYSHLVYGVCLTYFKDPARSKDAVLEIFEKLMAKLVDTEIRNFKSWMFTVSKNYCLNQLEKEQVKLKHEREYMLVQDQTEIEGLSAADLEAKEERLQLLLKTIEELKPEQKVCVELFYLKQKPYQEVAEITGYTLMQVKSYLQNGKRNLKLLMDV